MLSKEDMEGMFAASLNKLVSEGKSLSVDSICEDMKAFEAELIARRKIDQYDLKDNEPNEPNVRKTGPTDYGIAIRGFLTETPTLAEQLEDPGTVKRLSPASSKFYGVADIPN
jgi:hypothetical protein